MSGLSIEVTGIPAPQGSKRHVGNGRMIESSKSLPAWRLAVTQAAIAAINERGGEPGRPYFNGPVMVGIGFYFPRPKNHYQSNDPKKGLRPSAPKFKPSKPDIDKLIRAILDALTGAGVWVDDSRAVSVSAQKIYSDSTPGAVIRLWGYQ